MPLYYFVTSRNNVPVELPDGIDLPNAEAAWEEATRAAGEILRDIDGSLSPGTELTIEIQDGARKAIRILRVTAEAPR